MKVSDENLHAAMTGLSPLGTTVPSKTPGNFHTLDSGNANLKTQSDAALNCAWRETET